MKPFTRRDFPKKSQEKDSNQRINLNKQLRNILRN